MTFISRSLLLAITLIFWFLSASAQPTEKPRFGAYKCRADAQTWTVTEFTKAQQAIGLSATGVLVNGQIRMLPIITFGVTVHQLEDRAFEMATCQLEDKDFQAQFNTYALVERLYREEVSGRYVKFLLDHHLLADFAKEDAKAFQ